MSQTDWDVVIVGGGLSGLSLAVELAQPAFSHLRVLVLEKRCHYTRDRTWSYWATKPHRYSVLERKRWSKWRVRFAGQDALQTSAVPYCSLDADAFYTFAVEQIAAAQHIQLRMGVSVSGLTGGSQPAVTLDDGSVLTAKQIMDARPRPNTNAAALGQHFMGWEITTDTDCFTTDVVELMDFQQTSAGLHFFYVLPYGPRQALIETTWISDKQHQPDYAAELQAYISRRYGIESARVSYREKGWLDLQMSPVPSQASGITPLGRGAGTLRPSTGYAFLQTVEDAKRIASCFEGVSPSALAGLRIAPYQASALDSVMDKVFLQTIKSDWARAPRYFLAMFKGVAPDALVVFLSGHSGWWQRLQVASRLPIPPFFRAALACLAGK